MLGFFDSGIGGLTVLSEFRKRFPDFDMAYFGDRENCPYGDKTDDEIRALTEAGVEKLFGMGASVVILACNTASAHAVRHLQQHRFPDRKILTVTIPGAEKVAEAGYRRIGVLATQGTVRVKAYKERVHILDDSVHVHEIAAPELVPLIEKGITEGPEIEAVLMRHIDQFQEVEAIVLGCTHYPLVRASVEKIAPGIDIVDPGFEAARKFSAYLERHPEVAASITRGGRLRIELPWWEGVPDEFLGN
jgi:glutamate racemase